MATNKQIFFILMSTTFLVNGEIIHENVYGSSNKDMLYQTLLDRIDVLEKKAEEHPVQLENIRQEFEIKMEELRQSHAAEISRLRNEFEEQISSFGIREDISEHFVESYEKESLQPHGIDDTESIAPSLPETRPLDYADKKEDIISTSASYTMKFMKHPCKPEGERELRNRIRRTEGEMAVAFFASVNGGVVHLGQNQNVKFDQVVTNTGNAYDKHLGVFRAPVPGIYVFSTTIVTEYRNSSHFGFFLNSQRLTVMWLHGAENAWDGGSNTIVLNLNKDDDVSVRQLDSDKAIHGDQHSMFSGFLLTQIDPQLSVVG